MANGDISKIFAASSVNTSSLFSNVSYFFIPDYQRQFSWTEEKLKKLFGDICHGYRLLAEIENNVTFIGSIILVRDDSNNSVVTENKMDLPSSVQTIIDGQQRLTSLILFLSLLNEKLISLCCAYDFEDNVFDNYLKEVTVATIGRIRKIFTEEREGTKTNPDYMWYPRVTRAYTDTWSTVSPVYKSPIAAHLFKYGKFSRQAYDFLSSPDTKNCEQFTALYDENKELQDVDDKDVFIKAIRHFRAFIKSFCDKAAQDTIGNSDASDDFVVPTIPDLVRSQKAYSAFFEKKVPEKFFTYLEGSRANGLELKGDKLKAFQRLTQLNLFSGFVLYNVGVTQVIANNESYAFDIFESLNTTGDPLTAIETFKAKVLQIKTDEVRNTCRKWMDEIDKGLNEEGPQKKKSTDNLLISFALEEKGVKLAKKLNEQRHFLALIDRFDLKKKDTKELKQIDADKKKEEFVKALHDTYLFTKHVWIKEKANKRMVFEDEVEFCLDFLVALGHTIVQGLLTRYYSSNPKDLPDIVKACVAFTVLRRAAATTTDSIDNDYRRVMAGVNGGKPACRLNHDDKPNPLPTVKEIQKELRNILAKKGIDTKESWIKQVEKIPIYTVSKEVARFLLIAASDLTNDENPNERLRASKKLLDEDAWGDSSVATIEHIVPQTQDRNKKDWPDSKYIAFYNNKSEEEELKNPLLHGLGNLVPCPKDINTSFGNKSWKIKRIGCEVCSAPTKEKVEELMEKYKDFLPKKSLKLYEQKYLPMLRILSKVEEDQLGEDFIRERGRRIAELAWERIHGWLGLPN